MVKREATKPTKQNEKMTPEGQNAMKVLSVRVNKRLPATLTDDLRDPGTQQEQCCQMRHAISAVMKGSAQKQHVRAKFARLF